MSGLDGALCVGQGPLFESTNIVTHREAAELCAACPAIEACRRLLDETLNASATAAYRGVVGTWAGELFGVQGRPRPVVACGRQPHSKGTSWDNKSGAGSTLATSSGTSTNTHLLRGRARRGP